MLHKATIFVWLVIFGMPSHPPVFLLSAKFMGKGVKNSSKSEHSSAGYQHPDIRKQFGVSAMMDQAYRMTGMKHPSSSFAEIVTASFKAADGNYVEEQNKAFAPIVKSAEMQSCPATV